jgi:hypothetical protein
MIEVEQIHEKEKANRLGGEERIESGEEVVAIGKMSDDALLGVSWR